VPHPVAQLGVGDVEANTGGRAAGGTRRERRACVAARHLERPMRDNLWRRVATLALLITVVVAGCSRAAPPAAALPPVEVTVSQPITHPVAAAVECTGSTAAVAAVEVRARVTGFLERVHVEPRAQVRAGDVLFSIDARPFTLSRDRAQAALDAARAQLSKAESDAEKVQRLFEQGMSSADELTTQIAVRDAARAAVAEAEAALGQAELQLQWCAVTAPISGRVSRNLVDPGNIVMADQTLLATLVNDDEIFAYFNLSERDVLTLQARTAAAQAAAGRPHAPRELRDVRPPVQMALMTDGDFVHAGVIDYAAPGVDPTTGTIEVRGRFDNAAGYLLPGLFARIRVPLGEPQPALVVTERALGAQQGQRYVLVVNAQNVVEFRPVTVGLLQDGLRVVTAGLAAEDWVIVNGMQRVRPGLTVQPVRVPMPGATATPTAAPAATTAPAQP
jgi:RND family efflux transporter MFP subunit